MIVLVCGGRDYVDRERVFRALDILRPSEVIHGGAAGVDQFAGEWAQKNDTTCCTFRADWIKHGRSAGPIRNQEMLLVGKPDLVLYFPGGRGTADMVRRARRAFVKVLSEADVLNSDLWENRNERSP